jgi:hypothetical protein
MKRFVIPVIIGVTGIVTEGLKNQETVPGKHSVDSLQITAVLGTSHTVREVLQSESWGAPLVEEEKYQGKGNL